jgi:hypothetical protein
MDATRFDGLTRLLGTSSSRRAALRLLLAATAASPGLVPVGSGARKRPARRKRKRLASSGTDVSKAQCRNQCHSCSPLDVRSGADLQGCDLRGLVLTKRDLSGCDLRGACLQGADLREASLDGANLDGACLRDAILAGTSLRGVSLHQANLCGANLTGADLSGSRVDAAQLACALVCNTRMPDGSLGDDDRGTSRACPACDDACLKDETCCGNECASLETDIRHCARCDNACPPPTAHATVSCGEAPDLHGRLVHDCLYTCEEGWEDCDNDFDTGCEVFTRGDANNCGGCGSRCADGMVCCNCQCVSPGSGQCGRCSTVTSARLIRRR